MTVTDIIDGVILKKNEIGMTNQQLADASGVPKSTVDKICRRDTSNPTMQTILDLAAAVGYSFSNHPDMISPVSEEGNIKDPMVRQMIHYYERQAIAYEERIKRVTSHFNMMIAEKNRWIQTLAIIIGLIIAGIVTILLIDLATPDVGWFPHDASSLEIALAIIGIIVVACGVILLRKKVKE